MSVHWLPKKLIFPHHKYANEDGILALGGDLSIERLLFAYENGIFPWYSPGEPIIWWSPHERCILFPGEVRISKSMKRFLNKGLYQVTSDQAFEEVIEWCGKVREETGTWITDEMKRAYIALHRHGFAHSVEVWDKERLVGGLYGVSIGKFFAGESMFSLEENASKVALISLCQKLQEREFHFIDCQLHTPHLESMGAVTIPRELFLATLQSALETENIPWAW